MTARQCEIAGESYAACMLAQCGYDVLVQYGANQPDFDLVAVKDSSSAPRMLRISVKASQDGGWVLAVRYKDKNISYLEAADIWLQNQKKDVIFLFVQFLGIKIGEAPRTYVARAEEIARHLKSQCNGQGYGTLHEDIRRDRPRSIYDHKIPDIWTFSQSRIDSIL